MKLLDLYCKAGGAAMGYFRAGFTEIVGVDLEPQPNYPFTFVQADALRLPFGLETFDAIHASPPCQRYSNGAKKWGTSDSHPDLIPPTRELLIASGKPWVMENIESAREHMRFPIMLCGEMFGLGVFRHRLFESPLLTLGPSHAKHSGKVGDGRFHTVTGHAGGSSKRDGWKGGSTEDWRRAMGINWMTGSELAEAIPPAYTEWIGKRILEKGTN
jgi:DNA (cytosine-5)-methyltransferase 1